MVGKARGTTQGRPGGTSGEAGAASMDANTQKTMKNLESRENEDTSDMIQEGNLEDDPTEMIYVDDVIRDLTGRDTPGGRISDLAQGKVGHQSNLGTRAGRTDEGADIPGGGASPQSKQRKNDKE